MNMEADAPDEVLLPLRVPRAPSYSPGRPIVKLLLTARPIPQASSSEEEDAAAASDVLDDRNSLDHDRSSAFMTPNTIHFC